MISIWSAYTQGIRIAWDYKKVVFLLYGINLFVAYLLLIPFSTMLAKALDNTTAALQLLEAFDITIFSTIISEYGRGSNLIGLIISYGFVYLILNTFIAGGILHLLKENIDFSMKEFLTGCVTYFKRFIKLLLLSVLFMVAVLITFILLKVLFGLFTKNAVTEFWPFLLNFLSILLLICMIAIINMLFDYAKIIVVYNDFYKIFRSVKDTIMFVMMSMGKTLGLYGLYFLTSLIFLYIYLYMSSLIYVTGPLTIFLFFIVSQLYMIVKMFIRLCFFTGQFKFYKNSNTAMPGMTEEMLDGAAKAYEERLLSNKEENQETGVV
jgi:hypothetical protein